MLEIISASIALAVLLVGFRLLVAKNFYERIACFCFIFTNLSILLLTVSIADFNGMLDLVLTLFFLQIMTVLFMLRNSKSS